MSERLDNHIQLLKRLHERLHKAQSQSDGFISEEILHQLTQVIDLLQSHSDDGYEQGRDWLVHVFTHQPQLTPAIDRDLLWFFGGDCLHFMTDDEMTAFQQLEELEEDHAQRGEAFDRNAAKALLLSGQRFNA